MRATDQSEPPTEVVIQVAASEKKHNENETNQGDKKTGPVLVHPKVSSSQPASIVVDPNCNPLLGSGSGYTLQNMQQNIVYVPQNMSQRVVYVSNHNPGEDSRVVNVLQGREFYATSNVTDKQIHDPNKMEKPNEHKQNTMPERVVYVENNIPESGVSSQVNSESTQPPNHTETRVVYVHQNSAGGDTTTDSNTHTTNNTGQRVMYMPNNITGSNMNIAANSVNMNASNPNLMPVPVVYMPQQMQDGKVNIQTGIPGVAIHAPNDMQNFQNMAYPMPSRTPSPSRTRTPSPSPNINQERTLQVAQQVMTMAGKMLKTSHGDNHNAERIVYLTQPTLQQPMYSPYMQPMQYSNPYASQQMLQQEPLMPQIFQPTFAPPSPQIVHDGMYMASPPDSSSFISQETLIPQDMPDMSVPTEAPSGLTEYINEDMAYDDCCSWYDCCFSCFDCCSE